MKRFKPQKLNKNDHRRVDRAASIIGLILRIILTPIYLLLRIYHWVWDYDYIIFKR